ncbi:Copia protein [Sesamum angolense]|uniref:Copia protein n=1 Tax=Sesamum angolense TaxID=2727404 RepID=A0AAE1VYQ5_9LAMI|nr:Copia protein [Sesamum angolense]
MDLDQNGFDPSKLSIHSNVEATTTQLWCHESWHNWNRGKLHHCFECRSMLTVFLSHETWERRFRCNSVDGLGLTQSNMIRSFRSCEEKMSKNPLTLIIETRKFNGTNYNDWLRNLRIVLDFENQGYVLDKPLPVALSEGSSPEEHVTYEKWFYDNCKVRSIILALIRNDIQEQYDRLEDVPSIMLNMKEVYVAPNRHIRYAATIVFFGTKMAEGSSVQSYGVKMLSLVEKLEDLKAGLDNDTCIDKRKKGKEKVTTATASAEALLLPIAERAMGKERLEVLSSRTQMMCACIAKEMGIERGSVHNSSPTQVLERSRKLSKDEMILRLGDGKAVAAEVSNLIMTAQHKRKSDNHENAQLWHAWLGHISKDRIRKLVDWKSLEIDDLDNLPTCESCLKGKMTKKSFVGQSALANSLLYFINTDVYGPLKTPTRGGFSYFITFIDDHSRHSYVYLMRYKFEAFGRFKEYRLEVENQTGHKIKALQSDRGGEYVSGEFMDYVKENRILSQWTPLETPQLNGVAERRIRTLSDMVRSMMSFTELPLSFWGYALETAAKLLNIAPSKTVPLTPYKIWHGKPASYKYLGV